MEYHKNNSNKNPDFVAVSEQTMKTKKRKHKEVPIFGNYRNRETTMVIYREGLTAEEIASKQPEEPKRMQMTDARCRRCLEKKAGIHDIFQAGHGSLSRFQLECTGCGNTWYASRDEASTLTIEGPSSAKNVGTAPLATAKFEDVEKQLASPRDSEKPASDVFKKMTEAYMPVLGTQRSFNKPRTEDSFAMAKKVG